MRFVDPNTQASSPGGLQLSLDRLRTLDPGMMNRWWKSRSSRSYPVEALREHLLYGDSRAALVISVNPLHIAAYTDEFDASVVLGFDAAAVPDLGWTVGQRLLTVNLYAARPPFAEDIVPGTGHIRRWYNVHPVIAETVIEDPAMTAQRKAGIDESEWQRAAEAVDRYLDRTGGRVRDGRPSRAKRPVKVTG